MLVPFFTVVFRIILALRYAIIVSSILIYFQMKLFVLVSVAVAGLTGKTVVGAGEDCGCGGKCKCAVNQILL